MKGKEGEEGGGGRREEATDLDPFAVGGVGAPASTERGRSELEQQGRRARERQGRGERTNMKSRFAAPGKPDLFSVSEADMRVHILREIREGERKEEKWNEREGATSTNFGDSRGSKQAWIAGRRGQRG